MKFYLLFILASIYSITNAQFTIEGNIKDKSNIPIEFATIIFQSVNDSSSLYGTISNINGDFILNKPLKGDFFITIQMIGYNSYKDTLSINKNINLSTIYLNTSVHELSTIDIIAEDSFIEYELGKKTLNIGKDLSNSGNNVNEALEQVPSISSNEKGEILLRGSDNIIIYINGKETKRNSKTLKYIPANALSKIEIITNPSAQYDAEGVAGIINLVYKKNTFRKTKIEVNSTITYPWAGALGLNLSHQHKKLSLNVNTSEEHILYKGHAHRFRNNHNSELNYYIHNQNYNGLELTREFNSELNYENGSSSIALSMNYLFWRIDEETNIYNKFRYSQDTLELFYKNESLTKYHDYGLNLSYFKEFKNKSKINFQSFINYEINNNNSKVDDNLDLTLEEVQRIQKYTTEIEKEFALQTLINYETKFFNFGTLETGIKYDFFDLSILQNIELFSNPIPTNDFGVKVHKGASYFTHTHKVEKVKYSLGLRAEYYYSQLSNGFDIKNFGLFPSINFLYSFNEDHSLDINYTRRINRPGSHKLNPYINYIDPLNLFTGNPFLKPEIGNLIELNHHVNYGKISTDMSLFWKKSNDYIQNSLTPIDASKNITTYENFKSRTYQGIELMTVYRINKYIKSTATFSVNHSKYKDNNQAIFSNQNKNWSIRLSQQFKLPKLWTVQWNAYFKGKQRSAQYEREPIYSFDFSIRKTFLNKRGTITFNAKDLFNVKEISYNYLGSFTQRRNNKWQSQQFILGFRYILLEKK